MFSTWASRVLVPSTAFSVILASRNATPNSFSLIMPIKLPRARRGDSPTRQRRKTVCQGSRSLYHHRQSEASFTVKWRVFQSAKVTMSNDMLWWVLLNIVLFWHQWYYKLHFGCILWWITEKKHSPPTHLTCDHCGTRYDESALKQVIQNVLPCTKTHSYQLSSLSF